MSDETAGEFEECFMDVGPALPADAQTSEAVQPRKTPLHDPAVGAKSRAVQGAAAGDGRHDAAGADLVAVDASRVYWASVANMTRRLTTPAPSWRDTLGLAA
jgi:hypothetical protein